MNKRLTEYGWRFQRHGGKHDYWTNGTIFESVPRHNEVNEILARKILKTAQHNPPTK